jgi:hypothetical protein
MPRTFRLKGVLNRSVVLMLFVGDRPRESPSDADRLGPQFLMKLQVCWGPWRMVKALSPRGRVPRRPQKAFAMRTHPQTPRFLCHSEQNSKACDERDQR